VTQEAMIVALQLVNKKKMPAFYCRTGKHRKKTGIVILPHSSNQQQVKLSKD
jgi:hypothetical protein